MRFMLLIFLASILIGIVLALIGYGPEPADETCPVDPAGQLKCKER